MNIIILPSEYFPPPHPDSDLNDSNVISPPGHILTVFISDSLLFSNSTIIVFLYPFAFTEIPSSAFTSAIENKVKIENTSNNEAEIPPM